jgi:hypothetical protein
VIIGWGYQLNPFKNIEITLKELLLLKEKDFDASVASNNLVMQINTIYNKKEKLNATLFSITSGGKVCSHTLVGM